MYIVYIYNKHIYSVYKDSEIGVYFHGNKSLYLPETIKAIFKISHYYV